MNVLLPLALLGLAAPQMGAPSENAPNMLLPYLATCNAAGKRLWNHSLCAPVVAVNPVSGSFIASQAPPGPLPAVRANTSFEWMGTTWLMVLLPLPADPAERSSLLFHESFHVHQRELGLPPNSTVAPHLESARSRKLIRLEWNALSQALQAKGGERVAHARQALAFRAERLAGDPSRADAEREQMLHEGLAAYTGTALSGAPLRLALVELGSGPARPGLSRTFAYVNGPAWGLLLDDLRPDWRKGLGTSVDLPDLSELEPAEQPDPARYGNAAIRAEEDAAAAARQVALDRLLAATDPARSLRVPLAQMGMDFDPNLVTPAPDGSTIYEKIALRDRWGSVKVDGQAVRIAKDFSAAYIQWPLSAAATIELAPGWTVVDGDGDGKSLRPPD